jgi:polyisoprenoid-binding protein YceI
MRISALILAAAAAITLAIAPASAEDRFELDPAHTQVAFSIERGGFTHILGRFDTVSGELVLDQAAPANSSVHALIQTASLSSGNARRDEHLRSERWLNVAAFPTIEFRSTVVRVIDATHAAVTGDLTLMGQTHPITLDVTLNRIGAGQNGAQQAGFSATATLSRAAYGFTAGAPMVGDEVRITIEALARPPQPAAPATPAQ